MRRFAAIALCFGLSACLDGTPELIGTGATVPAEDAAGERRRSTFGTLWPFGGQRAADVDDAAATVTDDTATQPAPIAAAKPIARDAVVPDKPGGDGVQTIGLFAELFGNSPKDDQMVIPASLVEDGGTSIAAAPAGLVTRACGLSGRALGTQVDQHPAGRPVYRLYDSKPGTVASRAHYITGFSDGCPRRFQAALALFGSTTSHDIARYTPDMADIPLTAADRAYEDIRRRICRVPQKATCAKGRLNRLDRSTVFVTAYTSFETSRDWTDILVHDGAVVASSARVTP